MRCVLVERGCVCVGCLKRCETHHTLSSMSMSRTALLRGATRVLQRVTTRPAVSSSQLPPESHPAVSVLDVPAQAQALTPTRSCLNWWTIRTNAPRLLRCVHVPPSKLPPPPLSEIVLVAGRRDAVV